MVCGVWCVVWGGLVRHGVVWSGQGGLDTTPSMAYTMRLVALTCTALTCIALPCTALTCTCMSKPSSVTTHVRYVR
jgi:hypothetical protein